MNTNPTPTINDRALPKSSTTDMDFPFMKLPTELRIMVYEQVVFNEGVHYLVQQSYYFPQATQQVTRTHIRQLPASLSLVCQEVHKEYAPIEQKMSTMDDQQLHHTLYLVNERKIDVDALWLQEVFRLWCMRSCTLMVRVDWNYTLNREKLDTENLAAFITSLVHTEDIRLEVHCPADTPLYEAWLDDLTDMRLTKLPHWYEMGAELDEYGYPLIASGFPLYQTLRKLDIYMHSTLAGEQHTFHVVHAEKMVDKETKEEDWPKKKADGQGGYGTGKNGKRATDMVKHPSSGADWYKRSHGERTKYRPYDARFCLFKY